MSTNQSWSLMTKVSHVARLFVSLTWLSAAIYFMLGQLMDDSSLYQRYTPYNLQNLRASPNLSSTSNFSLPNPNWLPWQQYAHHEPVGEWRGSHWELPVFVMVLSARQLKDFYSFVGSFRIHFPRQRLLLYDVDLSDEQLSWVRTVCECVVRTLHWEKYPPHLQDLSLHAYRPILVQAMLQEFGAIFWCSPSMQFNSSSLGGPLELARTHGLASWSLQKYPTAAFTHYSTFRYFNTSRDSYLFHRMVSPLAAIYVNTDFMKQKLLPAWVQCALETQCISPPGAQANGCNYLQKPRYTYLGCHAYDAAALNVLLGQLFQFAVPFISTEQPFVVQHLKHRGKEHPPHVFFDVDDT